MSKKLNQIGSVGSIITIVMLLVTSLALAGFGYWAFTERATYKDKAQTLVDAAVVENTKKVQSEAAATYAQEAKNPLKTYTGPVEFAGVRLDYPKTWSGYVVQANSNTQVDAYFHPDVVPSVLSPASTFALRMQVLETSYSSALNVYANLQKQGKVSVAPYALPKVPNVIGTRVDGQITQNKKGAVILIPVRDKTLKLWTESDSFMSDFNSIILPNASFSP